MSSGNIGKIKASRVNNVPNVDSYIGEKGILFFNFANGVIRLSDGITSGGVPIPYTIASNNVIGGIKPGPGIVISNDGELFIDTANLALSFGNFTANNNVLSITNVDQDMILQTQGDAEIQLVGNIGFYKPNGIPPAIENRYFSALTDGQVKFIIPTVDVTAGAMEIVGSTSGNVFPPVNSGVMVHITGQQSIPSRFYNDGLNEFAAFVGRRYNGNVANPTSVLSGQDIMRISATGYDGDTIPGTGSSRITFQAAENFTTTALGGNLILSVIPVGTTTLKSIAWVTGTGLTVNGNISGGNLLLGTGGVISSSGLISTTANISATGNISGGNLVLSTGGLISSSGLISTTSNISGGNILSSGSLTVTGNITAGNVNSYVILPTGTTTKAPLVFEPGNNLTTPTPGSVMYDGKVFSVTPQGQQRGLIKATQTYVINSDHALINQTTVQSLFGVSSEVSTNTRYAYSIYAIIYKSANNITMGFALGGNASVARHTYQTTTTASATLASLSTASVLKNAITTAIDTPVTITGALNGTGFYSLQVFGTINVTTGGIWSPFIAFSGLPGAGSYVAAGSSVEIYPLGTGNANVSVGNWT